jgi:hypothetical protein
LFGSNKFGTDQFETVFLKMPPAIMLNGFISHQLKLIQQVTFPCLEIVAAANLCLFHVHNFLYI